MKMIHPLLKKVFPHVVFPQILACAGLAVLCSAIAPAQDHGPAIAMAQPASLRSDDQIEEDVMRALDASAAPKSEATSELAISIASRVAGVAAVHNSLKVGDPQNAQDAQDAPAMPEPPPPPVVFQNAIPADQLAFLNDFANHLSKEVVKDKRFRNLMKQVTPRTTYHYGSDMSLSETSETLLGGTPLPVDIREGRYVMVGTRGGGPYLSGKAFVWFDMKEGIGLGGVYFHPTNGEPTPTLAIFSRQLKVDSLSMSQLPVEFAEAVSQWSLGAGVPAITTRYFIPDNGKKYVLAHDEDYCDHPENAPAPPQDVCEQMNADAAESDMNAAYFMQETHNAANATAWMLGPDQVAWIGVRERTCGAGLICRIRITRQRTRALMGGGPHR
jgi:uncharacterized protein YecT (DUF1311 family)